jgi:hypothetical protein
MAKAKLSKVDPAQAALHEDPVQIFRGVPIDPKTRARVIRIARQLEQTAGRIRPSDAAQLCSLALALQRSEDMREGAAQARADGDMGAFARLAGLSEKAELTARGLLKDMRLTRASGSDAESAAERKARGKTGSGWQGVV